MSDSDRLPPISAEGETSLRTRLHSLQSQYPQAPGRFAWLGLLPAEEGTLTPPMMAVWWQTEASDAQHHLELFCQEGLLLATAPRTIGGQDYPGWHLHAPLHDMARRLLIGEAENGLGLSAREAHRILLERYHNGLPQTPAGHPDWSQLADDGYIHDHLTWHMEQAAQFDTMLLLLNAETAGGKNAWFEAQDRLGKMARYREDVKRSWRAVQRRSQEVAERGEPITTLGLEIRHCLILAALNSLNADMPVELIGGLVQCGMWPLTVGVTYLRQISYPWDRVKAFAAFAPSLTAAQFSELVSMVRNTEHDSDRDDLLTEIAKARIAMGDTGQAIEIARAIGDAYRRAEALTEIACPLPLSEERSRILAEALEIARTIEDAYFHAWALCGIFTSLPLSEERSLIAAEALAMARKAKGAGYRANVLGGIAVRLPQAEERAQVMAEALANARKIQDASERERHISDLVKALAAIGDTEQALAIAETVAEDHYRMALLREIAEQQAQTEEQTQLPADELASAPALENTASEAAPPAGIAASPTCTEARFQELAQALSLARTSDDADACAEALPGDRNRSGGERRYGTGGIARRDNQEL